ncbi:aldo/keto reductase [Streptomyces sp. NBC_00576]|uniref:aldo/keto reductase n=1 Tax=Streptomyces sp. NBC_00576 TaxID=2903665 RepID=UPI002E808497|nr:aldo/keto reductase [Streptomyces sp. NBC_00576]WUB70501.1 aldo/keto reductase [Streptomyces sp. NBC_00576]
MEYRKLGNTGTAVSRIALGAMYFGVQTPEDEAFALLDAFVEAGGNLVDTSNVYGGGSSEEIIGRWFADRPSDVTDRVVLATKGRYGTGTDVNSLGSTRRQLRRSLDASLCRLGRDHVDLYQIHAWDPLTPVEETLSFLDDAVHSGKINYVGLSNFTGWQLQLTLSTAQQMGTHMPVTLQQQYSLLSRESEYEVIPAALHNHVSLLPWSPLAGGFLTGKYQRGTTPAPDTRAGSDDKLYQWVSAEYATSDRNWHTIDAVIRIARETGATPSQVALAWAADQPSVAAPVVGARTLSHLTENLGAAELHLDADTTAILNTVSAPQHGGYPYGGFGTAQRSRDFHGSKAQANLIAGGSDTPLGHA